MIQLNQISVIFSEGTPLENVVFQDLQLTIQPSEFVTIIGGNGAGKSTLLNLIAGDVAIHSGSLVLDNMDVTQWPSFERAKLISRVFQDPLLGTYADLTIEENLSLALSRGRRRSLCPALRRSARSDFQEYLHQIGIGLENRLNDKMGLLSGGQRQAVSLIMATLRPSKILLLDEHTAALDPKMEQVILDLTQKLITDKQLTALMITHCMSQALEYGTRTLVLHHGKIAQDLQKTDRVSLNPSDLVQFF